MFEDREETDTPSAKWAVIAGGGSGIGATTCQVMRRQGWQLAVVDLRPATGSADLWIEADATRPDVVALALASIAERARGVPAALVNTVGIPHIGSVLTTSLEEWDRVIRVNLTSAYILSAAYAKVAVNAGVSGAIVHVASDAGKMGIRDRLAYCASKAGLLGMVRQMAVDLAPLHIRINSVSPGPIAGGFLGGALPNKQPPGPPGKEGVPELPARFLGTYEDVANAIAWLVSDAATHVTGTDLAVDAGRSTSYVT